MKLLTVLAWTAAIVASQASAQAVYRCGNTYSQIPCEAGAKPARITSAAAPDQPKVASGAGLCADEAPRLLRFPDPPSTRVGAVKRGSAEVIQYADQPIAAKLYLLTLNTKNRIGAYDGERTYVCFLSDDERRILKVEPRFKPAEQREAAARPMTDDDMHKSIAAARAKKQASVEALIDSTRDSLQRSIDAEKELIRRLNNQTRR